MKHDVIGLNGEVEVMNASRTRTRDLASFDPFLTLGVVVMPRSALAHEHHVVIEEEVVVEPAGLAAGDLPYVHASAPRRFSP